MANKIAVIGAGASGLAAAIEAKRQSKKLNLDLSVTVFEHLDKAGKKLLATGNGRCNFCNTDLSLSHFHGDKELFEAVLSSEYTNTLDFFKASGIFPYIENGRCYPRSEQAVTLREALLKTAETLNIEITTNFNVEVIKTKNDKFLIKDNLFDAVIIATGGKSQATQGSDGSGYELLKAFGHKINEASPALTALTITDNSFKALKGLRLKGCFSLYAGKHLLGKEAGEIQFTDMALSGIPVMNLSHLYTEKKNIFAVIDSCYDFSEKELISHLTEARLKSPSFITETVLCGLVPQKIAYLVMSKGFADIKPGTLISRLSEKNLNDLSYYLKHIEFKVNGVKGFEFSQVTKGGASGEDFNVNTLMSKKQNGLFACGEVLDVNGDCGGYNLHFAWSSGRLSGASAIKFINEKRKQ